MCTVCIQECAGEINYILSSPLKYQPGLLGNYRYFRSLKVLLCRIFHKLRYIRRIDNNCHTLLGFGDSQLCTVKARILLGYLIQINGKAVCQLTDGNGNTARTEIVTLADQLAYLGTPEESLQLSFGRCITLLDFCAALLYGLLGMYLRGSGSTAAAVTSRSSA